ncbi:HIRAN domain-containing protein [bacterium]|nr:HIRAN domain-containing protein [bacterium]
MTTLFLGWQDPKSREWFVIGSLGRARGSYWFRYVKGARRAQEKGFSPLLAFPNINEVFESPALFPLFQNRILNGERPEWPDFLRQLNLSEDIKDDPIAVLARSAGRRATDQLEVFPKPEKAEDNRYSVHFFLRGLSHVRAGKCGRHKEVKTGERLWVCRDPQNDRDPDALLLRTEDLCGIGYVPRYLRDDLNELLDRHRDALKVVVEKFNEPPAPLQYRILCKASAPWPDDWEPMSGPEFQPVHADD